MRSAQNCRNKEPDRDPLIGRADRCSSWMSLGEKGNEHLKTFMEGKG